MEKIIDENEVQEWKMEKAMTSLTLLFGLIHTLLLKTADKVQENSTNE